MQRAEQEKLVDAVLETVREDLLKTLEQRDGQADSAPTLDSEDASEPTEQRTVGEPAAVEVSVGQGRPLDAAKEAALAKADAAFGAQAESSTGKRKFSERSGLLA